MPTYEYWMRILEEERKLEKYGVTIVVDHD